MHGRRRNRGFWATTLAGLAFGLALVVPNVATGAAPVRIAEGDSTPLVSGNVTPLLTIPINTPIGARFRDKYMFVSGSIGLTVYDVSNPRLPTPVGALPLPHFENEDVDLGGDILLISNDPSEGVGVLYVIDISDPTMPILAGAPLLNDFIASGLPPIFGQPEPLPDGIGHTVSCVNAKCSYAYLAGTGSGIDIVDLRDPSTPKKVGRFRPPTTGLATHDVQIDSKGIAWIVGGDGTSAYDVTDPVNPKLLARTDEMIHNSGQLGLPGPIPVFEIGGEGENPIDLIHHNSLRLGELAPDPIVTVPVEPPTPTPTTTTPEPAPTPTGESPAPEPAASQGTVIAPGSSPSSPAARKQEAAAKKRKAKKKPTCRTKRQKRTKACRTLARRQALARKKRQAKAKGSARAAATGRTTTGFRTKPFAQVPGKTYPAGGDSPLFGITEEDYNRPTCKGAGSFQTWGMTAAQTSTGASKLALLDTYTTELEALVNGRGWAPVTGLCSAHYFDYRDGIVAQGWYEEGTRFLDVRDPTDIKQVGYWVPTKGETWSVVYPPTDPTGTVVYAMDFARGIDVLELDRSDLKPRRAPVRRSWLTGKHGRKDGRTALTGASKRSRYGFVCRIAAAR